MTIWRMRIACWIAKATNTHPQYVILTDFPPQQWSYELASVLLYTYLACFVNILTQPISNIGPYLRGRSGGASELSYCTYFIALQKKLLLLEVILKMKATAEPHCRIWHLSPDNEDRIDARARGSPRSVICTTISCCAFVCTSSYLSFYPESYDTLTPEHVCTSHT
jgi:hypothetical protein